SEEELGLVEMSEKEHFQERLF
ncbi:MAG: hypothetical protein RL262_1690, partial [Bacteroidota bacterium]